MDEQKKTPKNTKLGFLGDSNVGKTSILLHMSELNLQRIL